MPSLVPYPPLTCWPCFNVLPPHVPHPLLAMPRRYASARASPAPALLAVQGGDFVIGSYMRPMSAISMLPRSAASLVHVDDFSIDYRPDGSVAQVGSSAPYIFQPDNWQGSKRDVFASVFGRERLTVFLLAGENASVRLPTSNHQPQPTPPTCPSLRPCAVLLHVDREGRLCQPQPTASSRLAPPPSPPPTSRPRHPPTRSLVPRAVLLHAHREGR